MGVAPLPGGLMLDKRVFGGNHSLVAITKEPPGRHPETAQVTLHDVAREVGVHPSTVSRALDPTRRDMVKEATRARIAEVAERMGYRPHMVARGLQSGRTATVGLITADLGNTWVTPVIHGIVAAIEAGGMMPVIAETQDDDVRFSNILDHMLNRRVDAIVALSARDGHRDRLESAARIAPVVVAARPLEGSPLPQVVQDDRAGGHLVLEHFAELGHRTVLQLRGPEDVANFRRRAKGFSAGCRERSIAELTSGLSADRPTIDEGYGIMRAFLESGVTLPSAIFAHNDLIAVGALAALREASLSVPDDVSLVGYNDLPMVGHLAPPLTTVVYRSFDVGAAAGDMVTRLLAGEDVEPISLAPTLAVRMSTRPV